MSFRLFIPAPKLNLWLSRDQLCTLTQKGMNSWSKTELQGTQERTFFAQTSCIWAIWKYKPFRNIFPWYLCTLNLVGGCSQVENMSKRIFSFCSGKCEKYIWNDQLEMQSLSLLLYACLASHGRIWKTAKHITFEQNSKTNFIKFPRPLVDGTIKNGNSLEI